MVGMGAGAEKGEKTESERDSEQLEKLEKERADIQKTLAMTYQIELYAPGQKRNWASVEPLYNELYKAPRNSVAVDTNKPIVKSLVERHSQLEREIQGLRKKLALPFSVVPSPSSKAGSPSFSGRSSPVGFRPTAAMNAAAAAGGMGRSSPVPFTGAAVSLKPTTASKMVGGLKKHNAKRKTTRRHQKGRCQSRRRKNTHVKRSK